MLFIAITARDRPGEFDPRPKTTISQDVQTRFPVLLILIMNAEISQYNSDVMESFSPFTEIGK